MKNLLLLISALCGISCAAIVPVQVPYILDSAATPLVSYVDANDAALQNKINQLIDSLNLYLGAGLKASRLSSTSDLNLTIDSDNNQTNRKFSVTNNGQTDTLFKVDENGRRAHTWGWADIDSGIVNGGGLTSRVVNNNGNGDTITLTRRHRYVFYSGGDTLFVPLPNPATLSGSEFIFRVVDGTGVGIMYFRNPGSYTVHTQYNGFSGDITNNFEIPLTSVPMPATSFTGFTLVSDGSSWWMTAPFSE